MCCQAPSSEKVASIGRSTRPRSIWRIEGCPCIEGKKRCGAKGDCKLKALYDDCPELIKFESQKEKKIRYLDYKFLMLFSISTHTPCKDKDGHLLKAFPFRVIPHKKHKWLGLIREVNRKYPGLASWGHTGTPHNDPFLDWIVKHMGDETKDFHQELLECLMPRCG